MAGRTGWSGRQLCNETAGLMRWNDRRVGQAPNFHLPLSARCGVRRRGRAVVSTEGCNKPRAGTAAPVHRYRSRPLNTSAAALPATPHNAPLTSMDCCWGSCRLPPTAGMPSGALPAGPAAPEAAANRACCCTLVPMR